MEEIFLKIGLGLIKKVNEEIKWRNGTKVIFHLADAGAHGKLFTKNDKYPEEEAKLIAELEKCAEKKIKIFGYVIDILYLFRYI